MTIHSIDAEWDNSISGGIDGIQLMGRVIAGPKATLDKRVHMKVNPLAAIKSIINMYARRTGDAYGDYEPMKRAADLLRALADELDAKAEALPDYQKRTKQS